MRNGKPVLIPAGEARTSIRERRGPYKSKRGEGK
jgi:hypothetical protein